MSITEKLMSSKDALSSLLTYANGVTGADDSNIGDAVKRLADGFGGGGAEVITGEITLSESAITLVIPHGVEPNRAFMLVASKAEKSADEFTTNGLIAVTLSNAFPQGLVQVNNASTMGVNDVMLTVAETRTTYASYCNLFGNNVRADYK